MVSENRLVSWSSLLVFFSAYTAATKVQYCVILDAGSSGSRAHIFRYTVSTIGSLPAVQELDETLKNHLPLASFATQPAAAGATLSQLIQYAAEKVPQAEHENTTIHLLATAGMRLLSHHVVQPILESCRQVLAQSAFKFRREYVSLVPGSSEGVYGFVAANYASGALQQWAVQPKALQETEFWGVLELGGASLQVTYQAERSTENEKELRHLSLAGQSLDLFTHSFLGFGQDAAQLTGLQLAADRLNKKMQLAESQQADAEQEEGKRERQRIHDPCLPEGFRGDLNGTPVVGEGYFSLCRQSAAELVSSNCSSLHCGPGGVLLPPLTGKFLCIENLQYTAGFLGVPHTATIRQVTEAAERKCAIPWPEMLSKFPDYEQDHLLSYCFGAAYGIALLHDSLGIDMDNDKLLFTDKIESPDGLATILDWTLGAVVVAASRGEGMSLIASEFPLAQDAVTSSSDESSGLPFASAVVVMLLMLGIVLAAVVVVNPRRRAVMWRRRRYGAAKRRESRASVLDYDSEDESTDSETFRRSPTGNSGGLSLGRRQNTSRAVDLEQGLPT